MYVYLHELLPPLRMGSPRAVKLRSPVRYPPENGNKRWPPLRRPILVSHGLGSRQLSYRPSGVDQKMVTPLLSTTSASLSLVAFPRCLRPTID